MIEFIFDISLYIVYYRGDTLEPVLFKFYCGLLIFFFHIVPVFVHIFPELKISESVLELNFG